MTEITERVIHTVHLVLSIVQVLLVVVVFIRHVNCNHPEHQITRQGADHCQRHASTKECSALILDHLFLFLFFLFTPKLMSVVKVEASRLHKYIAVRDRRV